MATNLSPLKIKDTFSQLLHVDGGVSATRGSVLGATGTVSALKIGTDNVSVDNILFDGNTISTLDTNGNLNLTPNGTGSVVITKVQIDSGTITGLTSPLPVASGGTGGSTQSAARTALGLGSVSVQDANNVAITGGSLSGMTSIISAFIRSTGSLGFTTGAGGTVTQATSKSTGVTLDKACGEIVMNNAALNTNTSVTFTLTNSEIAADDTIAVSIKSGASDNSYFVGVSAVAAGSCKIHLRNVSGGSLSEAVVLSFAVIRTVKA